MRILFSRLLGLFRKQVHEHELDQEMRSHLEMLTEENVRKGTSRSDARYAALRSFGGVEQTKEEYRDQRGLPSLESFFQDIRYGLRQLRRSLGFTLTAIITLALGIGANTAIFSLGNAFMFRPLPVKDAARLTVVAVQYHADGDPNQVSYLDYLDFKKQSDVFTDMTFYSLDIAGLGYQGHADRVVISYVPSNFFSMLGIRPALGRLIAPGEGDAPKTGPVVVLGHSFWQKRFGGDPQIVGRNVTLDGQAVTVIGVVPKEFLGPYTLVEMDAYAPIGMLPLTSGENSFFTYRRATQLRVLATLKPGVTPRQAEANLNVIAQRLVKQYPETHQGEIARVIPERLARPEAPVESSIPVVMAAFLIMVGLVLLVACFNVANLLLARAAARRQELAMRAVLGAGRGRLVRQTLTESILLGLLGGAAGCAGAWALLRVCISLAPEGMLRIAQARIDLRVLFFALAGSLSAALLFGMASALEPVRAETLASWHSVGTGRTLFRKALVATQVAISLVLLTGASLLLRSLWKLQAQPLGYDTEHVLTAPFVISRRRYSSVQAQANFFNELEERMKRIPGGGVFAFSDSIPPGGSKGRPYSNLRIAGHPPVAQNGGTVAFRWVSPDYFKAMGIRIIAGRAFEESERTSGNSPIILSASLARRLFGNENPLGQQIDPDVDGHWCTVVGVAADIKKPGLTEPSDPEYYRLRMHTSQPIGLNGVAVFRTSFDPDTLARWVRKEFSEMDPALPVEIQTLDQRVDQFREEPRFVATLVAMFASLGLALAAVGLYGVLSFLVARQTREIGVRMAIGARPADIAWHIQKYAGTWTAIGVALGLVGSFALARAIRGLLFEVSPNDPLSLIIATSVLVVTAMLAAWIPSRRASHVDPVVALRME